MDKSRVRTPVVVGVLCVLAWAIGDKISYQVRSILRGGGTAGDALDGRRMRGKKAHEGLA